MRMPRTTLIIALGALLLPAMARAQDKAGVTLEVVKYDGLKNAVAKHRGKVVLVDFWGEF
jgi:hypothetical protein